MSYLSDLNERMRSRSSLLCVGLDPDRKQLPPAFVGEADPLWAWNQAVIEATHDLVAAYKPNIAFYEAEGLSGLDALRRTIDLAHAHGVPVILDAKRGDIAHSAAAYARAAFEVWGADAVTVSPYLGRDSVEAFTRYAERGVYLLCHTSNPGAADLQELPASGRPLYQAVAERAAQWNEHGNIGLVVGATYPEAIRELRALTPDLPFLVPGVGSQGGDLVAAVQAGLDAQGLGLVINVSRAVTTAADPRAAAQALREAMVAAWSAGRHPAPRVGEAGTAGWQPALQAARRHDALVAALYEAGCVRFGDFVLHSGQHSPIYLDLRMLVAQPGVLQQAARAYAGLLQGLSYDRLAAIPYAALPIGTAVSLLIDRPLIYPRREAKSYGTKRLIEGAWQPGETAVVLDDLITTGASKVEAIQPLQEAGLQVHDVVVLIDREQGGREALAEAGYRVHAVLTLREILASLAQQGRISAEERGRVEAFLWGQSQ